MRVSLFTAAFIVATAIALPEEASVRPFNKGILQTATSKTIAASTSTSAASQCTPGDTSSAKGVQEILDSSGAMVWLDISLNILPNGDKDWVNQLWTTVFPDQGASPLSGCGDIGGDCPIDTKCQDYESVMGYWVFKSVASLHSKINAVRAELLWTGWLDGLSIDQIGKDFSVVSPDQSWAKWVSAAFSMAGGFATGVDLSKPLRGMMGFAAAGLTDVSLTPGATNAVDKTSVENTLRNIVGAAGNYVASILSNATGNGNPETLPIYTESTLEHATSRFLLDNTILIDENKDNSSFIGAYKGFAQNVEKKLVDVAMKSAWYMLFGEQDVEQKDCNMPGAFWLEGKKGEFLCFYLTRPKDSHDCENNDPITCVGDAWQAPYDTNNQMDNKIYDKLTKTYGFDLKEYYTSLIDCALYGSGEVDIKASTNNGKVARCFYNGYVRKGYWLDDGTQILDLYIHGDLKS